MVINDDEELEMSFSDDDKEALGEDLDDLKTNLARLELRAKEIQKYLRTLVTMAWVYIILCLLAAAIIVVPVLSE